MYLSYQVISDISSDFLQHIVAVYCVNSSKFQESLRYLLLSISQWLFFQNYFYLNNKEWGKMNFLNFVAFVALFG